jgi:hypothetical protein
MMEAVKAIKNNPNDPMAVRNRINTIQTQRVNKINPQQQAQHEAPKNQAGKGMRPM